MKTIFITGANKGIGYAMALELVLKGSHVIIGARDESRGKQAVKELEALIQSSNDPKTKTSKVDFVQIDISNKASIKQATDTINSKFGSLSLLINNAGIPGDMHKVGWEFDTEELQTTYNTNFLGTFEVSKLLLNTLKQNKGTILSVSIPIEPASFFNAFAYQTSKSALNVMTKSWGLSFKTQNIPVTIMAVMPGAVSTDLNNHVKGDFVKQPEEAAKLILSFLDDKIDHNGHVINFDGRIANYMDNNTVK